MRDLTTISIVRDEEDIVEAWVRHHAPRVRRMLIVLHKSTDSTEAILRRLQTQGYPLDLRTDGSEHYPQEDLSPHLLRDAAATGTRWVLPLDADEFLCGDLPEKDGVILLPWRTHVPCPDDDADERDPVRRITRRKRTESPQYHKVLIPAAVAADPGTRMPLGNHALLRADGTPYPATVATGAWLAHFPVRSEKQIRGKVLRGWESQRCNPAHRPGQIFQWEALHARCEDPAPMTPEELRDIALRYAVPEGTPADGALVREPVDLTALRPFAARLALAARRAGIAEREALAAVAAWAEGKAFEAPENARAILDGTDRGALIASLRKTHGTEDLLAHFYDYFLDAFDRKRGGAAGVSYTPVAVAERMTRTVEALLRDSGVRRGLADHRACVTDLGAGSGTLLLAAMRRMRRGGDEHALRHAGGIELMEAAGIFARARMRRDFGAEAAWTCGDMLGSDGAVAAHLETIGGENDGAIAVVLSNPPYNRLAEIAPAPGIRAVLARYGGPADAWALALARAHAMLLAPRSGVGALVLPGAALHDPAFAHLRRALREDFRDIRALMLHGGPGGPEDEHVFPYVDTPMCVLFLSTTGSGRTFLARLHGSRAEKREWLESGGAPEWTETDADFRPLRQGMIARLLARKPAPVTLACAVNENYALGAAVAIRSALDHLPAGQRADVVVLETRLTEETKRSLLLSWERPGTRVRFLRPDLGRVAGLKLTQHMQSEVYFRLLLPDLLPDAKRVLYLDSDLLVRESLLPLWRTDMEGHAVAAVQDVLSSTLESIPGHAALGLRPDAPYCNTGVLLLDVGQWRRSELTRRVLAVVERHPESIRWWDQDGLNAVLGGEWLQVDRRWNDTSDGARLFGWEGEGSRDPAVIHFLTRYKPWFAGCRHPAAREWLEILDRTAWRGWRPESGSEMPWPPEPIV